MKDEETQHKGIVGILSNFGEHARKEPLNLIREIQRMRTGIPKKVGLHTVMTPPVWVDECGLTRSLSADCWVSLLL